ncbi:MAG TPA: endonuclease/exonuclease/phosphatase family protein [Bacteroidota bacterium]|nr:endonuclease/exonuclease/phosphatase family protein [Bacteroidota bacterium]
MLRIILLHVCTALLLENAAAQSLKIATANIWSGVDYKGSIEVGEYESPDRREQRVQSLLGELRRVNADVIALQEVNPVHRLSERIADELGYDVIYQRANGGIKVGGIGIPTNLNEGLALLARKELGLEMVDVWDLSRTSGLFGNSVSFHVDDQNIALVGRIFVSEKAVYIANVHLTAAVPWNDETATALDSLIRHGRIPHNERTGIVRLLKEGDELRTEEFKLLAEKLQRLLDEPVILCGDFNVGRGHDAMNELVRLGFFHTAVDESQLTWDAEENTNIRFSTQSVDAKGVGLSPLEVVAAWHDTKSRTIDYILLSPLFARHAVRGNGLFLNQRGDGVFASDHFGVWSEIDAKGLGAHRDDAFLEESRQTDWDALPILSYDTDVGFGYGLKGFFLNYLGKSESIDFVAFNSTKGERWYRFVFSIPDFELRQGKKYDFSFDLIADYDKYLANNFFGVGNQSRKADREVYTKEPLEIQAVFGRGATRRIVVQTGVKVRTVRNFGFADTSLFARSLPSVNHDRSTGVTVFGSFRYDSRNSYINPSHGNVAQVDLEGGSQDILGDYSIVSAALSLQTYRVLFYPKTVLALRWMMQSISGSNLPTHTFVTLGGNKTLRGYPQDRFLHRVMMLGNVEVRFPIAWRFDGVLFYDTGNVWRDIRQIGFAYWKRNNGVGLRFVLDTFIVRGDLGFSNEGTGFYLNFGHTF